MGMNFRWLKRYFPKGLYARAALILLLPIISLQILLSVVFIQRHFEDVTVQMTRSLALEIAFLNEEVETSSSLIDATARISRLSEPLSLKINLPAKDDFTTDTSVYYDLSGKVVISTLRDRIPNVRGIDLETNARRVLLWLDSKYGVMRVSVNRGRVSASNPHQILVIMLIVGSLMTLVAFLFLRNQLRPIRRLARAAEAFGKGRVIRYRPSGATEVRQAGASFLDMRARIERQIEQRTMMLSGVSHDLRTPLTRLRLGLSMLEQDDDTKELKKDVDDMEGLLDEFLSFARGDALDDLVETDPNELIVSAAENAIRAGGRVSIGAAEGVGFIMLRPVAITRALDNLVGNALRYGNEAVISLNTFERAITITVEDDGPGIPEDRRTEAMKPFARLDEARNQNKGSGVGLGLAIANDIARRHGGSICLGHSETLGGLKVDMILAR